MSETYTHAELNRSSVHYDDYDMSETYTDATDISSVSFKIHIILQD